LLDKWIASLLAGGGFEQQSGSDQVVVLGKVWAVPQQSHATGCCLERRCSPAHSCTLGYSEQDYDQLPLLSFDGRSIRNLVDVALAQVPLATFMFSNECEIDLPLPDSVRGRRPPWNSCATSASSRRGRRMSRQVCAALLFVYVRVLTMPQRSSCAAQLQALLRCDVGRRVRKVCELLE
jgi:hypothetical protein